MAKIFNKIRVRRPPYNKFDLSHERKMSFDMGELVPIMCQEIVPGDSFRVSTECMLRMAPMLAPIMHRVNVTTHYFFVPNRLLWDEWEDFITGGREGTSAPVVPFMTSTNLVASGRLEQGTLADYLGFPRVISQDVPIFVSALPFRAYTLIYDEYYRDQNVSAAIDMSKTSGEQLPAEIAKICVLRKRAWEKDYLTSALPFAQRGPSVDLPVDVEGYAPLVVESPLGPGETDWRIKATETPGGTAVEYGTGGFDAGAPADSDVYAKIEGLSSSTSINELRRSIRLQEWLEKMARGGARYVEQIFSHFGVKSSDARLQRPEYLGGGRAPIQISEVLATVQHTLPASPLGDMGGHGFSAGYANGFKRKFEEHGFVIGIMSVLPRTAYQQGIQRKFQRFDKFDYYWPAFANIGEQEVLNKEVYYTGVTGNDPEGTFGYQSRYAEYKYEPSSVHGEFRTSLSFWHMGRIFTSEPALNAAFIESDPTERIFAVTEPDVDRIYAHCYNRVDALRPMPYFGTPAI